jgi:hypothetical protein
MKRLRCSPNKENTSVYTCFSKSALVKIAKSYNSCHNERIRLTQTKRLLYDSIVNRLGEDETKWLDISFVSKLNNKDINTSLRSKKPLSWSKNKYEWLSTPELTDAMVQYEKKYKDFKYLGTVPSDCPSSIYCELSSINIKDMYKKKYRKLAVVYNLDTHNKPGSHWVALFINITKNTISYYDSYGIKYPIHIGKYIKTLTTQFKNMNRKVIVEYNKKRHQFGGTECGMYSINFIVKSLDNISLKTISKQNITDKEMNNLRDVIYR